MAYHLRDHPGFYWSNSWTNLGRPRISAKSIAEQLGILHERAESIIHEDLDMRRPSAKWVPKCLNADKKRKRWLSSKHNLEFCQNDPNNFLSRLVTMDETWLYHHDPETKQQSMEWKHSGSPRLKNSECKNPLENFSQRRHPPHLLKDQIIKAEYCSSPLVQLKDILKEKRSGRSARESCSCTTMSRFTEHLQPRRNWPS